MVGELEKELDIHRYEMVVNGFLPRNADRIIYHAEAG